MASTPGKPTIYFVGPTASGKSTAAMSTASELGGAEIICLDKATAWCDMDIGTAKPSLADRARVPHRLLDVFSMENVTNQPPGSHYLNDAFGTYPDNTTGILTLEARAHRARLQSLGNTAICVGGSVALYNNLYGGYTFPYTEPRFDPGLRELSCIGVAGMRAHLRNKGISEPFIAEDDRGTFDDGGVLFEQIVEAATRTHRGDEDQSAVVVAIDVADQTLQKRIEERIRHMFQQGLEEEAKRLISRHGWRLPLRSTVGYKEFRGRLPLDDPYVSQERVIELINSNTLRYARRQRAWYKERPEVHWVRTPDEATEFALTALGVL